MATGRKRKRQVEEEPAEPAPEEEEEGEQEDEAAEVEEEGEPEEPRPRRTAKTRAPKRSAAAPVPRQKAVKREPAKPRDPRQPSLFSRVGQERVSRPVVRMGGSILLSLLVIVGVVILFQLFAGSKFFALRESTSYGRRRNRASPRSSRPAKCRGLSAACRP